MADDRAGSSLPSARRLGQVAGIFLERVIGVLGRRGVCCLRPLRNASMAALIACGVAPPFAIELAGLGILLQRQREQKALDRDEAVACLVQPPLRQLSKTRARSGAR